MIRIAPILFAIFLCGCNVSQTAPRETSLAGALGETKAHIESAEQLNLAGAKRSEITAEHSSALASEARAETDFSGLQKSIAAVESQLKSDEQALADFWSPRQHRLFFWALVVIGIFIAAWVIGQIASVLPQPWGLVATVIGHVGTLGSGLIRSSASAVVKGIAVKIAPDAPPPAATA